MLGYTEMCAGSDCKWDQELSEGGMQEVHGMRRLGGKLYSDLGDRAVGDHSGQYDRTQGVVM